MGGDWVVFRCLLLKRFPAPQGGFTPLLVAAGTGNPGIMRLLLDAGADKEAKEEEVRGL